MEETNSSNLTWTNNTSNSSQPDGPFGKAEPHYFWPILIMAVVPVVAVTGNSLVLLAVKYDRRLQNSFNYFLVSLSITDLLAGVLTLPLAITRAFLNYFPLPSIFCTLWFCTDVVLTTATIFHMCIMSVDRYIAVRYPFKHLRSRSKKGLIFKITFIWGLSLTVPIPFVVTTIAANNDGGPQCVWIRSTEAIILSTSVTFYIPLIIMVVAFFLTLQHLRNEGHVKYRSPSEEMSTATSSVHTFSHNPTFSIIKAKSTNCLEAGDKEHSSRSHSLAHFQKFWKTHPDDERRKPCSHRQHSSEGEEDGGHTGVNITQELPPNKQHICSCGIVLDLPPSDNESNESNSPCLMDSGLVFDAESPETHCINSNNKDLLGIQNNKDNLKIQSCEMLSLKRHSQDSNTPSIMRGLRQVRKTILYRKQISAVSLPIMAKNHCNGPDHIKKYSDPEHNSINTRSQRNQRKASKTLGILFFVFVLMYFPFFLTAVIYTSCMECRHVISQTVVSVCEWLVFATPMVNPIIYRIFNPDYRKAFQKLLHCYYCKKQSGL
ncbi:5-hydroxytryptamine receptor 2C-like [Lingula anatina]|uniref:5-hydroxytryptamine receptor 2C-like n=1 Tax=Lingula anatina TaxID=7574 RepID=A0A1S3KBJ9_LINAN|nr:5-hydroxytryptamine receptor 2C-like [Lingula anatina]|eukprot:XP_013420013.1 5-hydroxytryptamine receptor 2C-like [Lingula anatina]